MKIVSDKITLAELETMAKNMYGNLVKAVVDVEKEVMAVDAELHADEEKILLEQGSKQANLWGINLYLQESGDEWIEYDSVINLRPSQGNDSRGVDDPAMRQKIRDIINQLVKHT